MYQLLVKALIYYCIVIIKTEMEKAEISIQFLVIFRQSVDVVFLLYARRLRGYTATTALLGSEVIQSYREYFFEMVQLRYFFQLKLSWPSSGPEFCDIWL